MPYLAFTDWSIADHWLMRVPIGRFVSTESAIAFAGSPLDLLLGDGQLRLVDGESGELRSMADPCHVALYRRRPGRPARSTEIADYEPAPLPLGSVLDEFAGRLPRRVAYGTWVLDDVTLARKPTGVFVRISSHVD